MSTSEGDKKYVIHIYTGSNFTAGTDANIHITLFGNKGDSGERHLDNIDDNFEKDKKDVFVIKSDDLGALSKVKIGHDNSGAASAWYLDKIVVGDVQDGTMYVFACDRWLADDEDDKQIVRELECTNITPGPKNDENNLNNNQKMEGESEKSSKTTKNEGSKNDENKLNNTKMEGGSGRSSSTRKKEETGSCAVCGKAASLYSMYENKRVPLCSRKCHDKYNKTKAKTHNNLLIQLGEDGDDDEGKDQDNLEMETEEIFQACHRGEENNKRLISLLESGQSPDQKNKNGQTLMTYSIAKGDVNTLRILDSAGANIDEADDNGRTPLMVATLIGAEKKIEFLLKQNANIILQDNDGRTTLHMTETNTTGDYAGLILKHEPDVINMKNNFDQMAAHLVAGIANKKVLVVLLKHGAKIDGLDNLGRAPLHWAVLQKAEDCVRLLLDHGDGHNVIDLPDRFGTDPIHYAVQINNINMVKMLVKKGCRVDSKDTAGRTPLLAASAQGFWGIFRLLTKKGYDVNEVDNEGFSALHHAASKGHTETCIFLIKHGADVNQRNKKDQTPMFPAVYNAHVDVVHTLVEKGAKCDSVVDNTGRNPAHYAAEKGHKGILRVIIQYSDCCDDESCDFCSPDDSPLLARDNEGHTPLYLTAANNNIDCLKMLIKRGVRVDEDSFRLLTEMGLIDLVEDQKSKRDAEANAATMDAAAWRKKYWEQKKRSLSLEDQLRKLKSHLDHHHKRLISQMERRKPTESIPKRLKNSQLTVCELKDQNNALRLELEITKAKVSSEAKLHSLYQKDINDIRDLRTDYRNTYKAFSQRDSGLSLLEGPDWLGTAGTPHRLGEVPKTKTPKWESRRNEAYLGRFRKSINLKPETGGNSTHNGDTNSDTTVDNRKYVTSADF